MLPSFFTAVDAISIECPRQTAADTIALVARDSPVSDIWGVLNTVRNCIATVNNHWLNSTKQQPINLVFAFVHTRSNENHSITLANQLLSELIKDTINISTIMFRSVFFHT